MISKLGKKEDSLDRLIEESTHATDKKTVVPGLVAKGSQMKSTK